VKVCTGLGSDPMGNFYVESLDSVTGDLVCPSCPCGPGANFKKLVMYGSWMIHVINGYLGMTSLPDDERLALAATSPTGWCCVTVG